MGSLGIKTYLLHTFRDVRDRGRIQVERLLWSAKLQGGRWGLVFFIFFIHCGRFRPLTAVSASVVGWLLAYDRQCSVQRPLGVYFLR